MEKTSDKGDQIVMEAMAEEGVEDAEEEEDFLGLECQIIEEDKGGKYMTKCFPWWETWAYR